MVNVGEQEKKLISDFTKFKDDSYKTLDSVVAGMDLAKKIVKDSKDVAKISQVSEKLSTIAEIITSFRVGINETDNHEKLWLVWEKTGSTEKYYYNTESDLTEKILCYLLMTFEKEICQKLSTVEAYADGYIYFSTKIKDHLHNIISNYMMG